MDMKRLTYEKTEYRYEETQKYMKKMRQICNSRTKVNINYFHLS